MELVGGDTNLLDESLGTLAHHEHREVVFLNFVGVVDVLQDLTESILEFVVCNGSV